LFIALVLAVDGKALIQNDPPSAAPSKELRSSGRQAAAERFIQNQQAIPRSGTI
jgi:hypothetical protein